jgi:hypothetical protein
MGMSGISKSSASKLCKDIDERVQALLKRPLTAEWPYLRLDAIYQSARGRPHRLGRRDSRRRGDHRSRARDRRPAHRPVRG